MPPGPSFVPLLLPADLPSLPAGAPYRLTVLSATYGVNPLLRPLREAARQHGEALLVDPRTAHFQYEGYMSMEDYRALPYSPGRTTLGTLWQPRDFATDAGRAELVDAVFDVQRRMGADLLLAPYFLVSEVDHPWLEVAVETAAVADRRADRPMGAVVCVELDAFLRPADRDALVEAWADVRADFVWLTVVNFDEREAAPDEARALFDLVDRLGRIGPLFLAHAGRTGLVAITRGAAGYAAGSYQLETFRKSFFREGLVNLRANTYYDPERMTHLPVRLAEAAAATETADRCDCRDCAGRAITRMVSRRLVAHALRWRQSEIAELASVPAADRERWLRDRLDAALQANRRARRVLQEQEADEQLPTGAFHYLEVLREITGGPPATIPESDRDL